MHKGKHVWMRYAACIVLLAAFIVAFELRLLQWQVVQGEDFEELSASGGASSVKMTAARGEILDKDGNVLAGNRTVYNVVFNATGADDKTLNQTIASTIMLLEGRGQKWINELPIERKEDGSYAFKADMESDIEYMKGPYMLNMQSYATAEDCMAYMTELYECEDIADETLRMKVIAVRYYMQKLGFSRSTPYTFAQGVDEATVAAVSEASAELPGVNVEVSTERYYENGSLAPHIVGEIYSLTQDQYNALSEEEKYSSKNISGYTYDDKRGQSGIESYFEDELRGENGQKLVYTDGGGNVTNTEVTQAPVSGNTVYLTLDSNLQAVANASLAKNVKAAQENGLQLQQEAIMSGDEDTEGFGEDCTAGATVVLSVDDFSILAASNYPTYDMNRYIEDEKYKLQLLNDSENTPMFNRAFDGAFMPGSVFKPCVACAGLEEGVITPVTEIFCAGRYLYYDDYQPRCLGYHSNVAVHEALAESCNVFFYDTGRQLGIDRLGAYANLFGLGVKTGVEIGESEGTMSSREEYQENHGVTWTDGLTIQAAIGQLDDAFTPLQLATYCATIANDGVRLKTHLLDHITDYNRQNVVSEYEPEVMADTGISQSTLDVVKAGMREVVLSGTGSTKFGDYGIALGAKTGTAEVPGHSDNVTFIAFAPYDDPEIAVAVVLQYGASGTYCQEVAKDILDAYFYGKTVNDKGELVFPDEDEDKDNAGGGESSASSDSAAASAQTESSEPASSESTSSQPEDSALNSQTENGAGSQESEPSSETSVSSDLDTLATAYSQSVEQPDVWKDDDSSGG